MGRIGHAKRYLSPENVSSALAGFFRFEPAFEAAEEGDFVARCRGFTFAAALGDALGEAPCTAGKFAVSMGVRGAKRDGAS